MFKCSPRITTKLTINLQNGFASTSAISSYLINAYCIFRVICSLLHTSGFDSKIIARGMNFKTVSRQRSLCIGVNFSSNFLTFLFWFFVSICNLINRFTKCFAQTRQWFQIHQFIIHQSTDICSRLRLLGQPDFQYLSSFS